MSMSLHLQNLILQCKTSEFELEQAAQIYYKPSEVEQMVYTIIGQARSAGAHALLQQHTPLSLHRRVQISCQKQ